MAIVAGSKVSTKLTILKSLADKVDQLIVGGGIANTFMLAAGLQIGKSLAEPDLLDQAKAVIEAMRARGAAVPIPVDVVTAKTFAADAPATVKAASDVADDDLILDIGPKTADAAGRAAARSRHHRLERPGRRVRVRCLRQRHRRPSRSAIADSSAFSIAGGGDTLAAIAKYGIERQGRLHLDRRRRLPRSAGRQDPAGVRDPGRSAPPAELGAWRIAQLLTVNA